MIEIVLKRTEAGRQALEKGGPPETTLWTELSGLWGYDFVGGGSGGGGSAGRDGPRSPARAAARPEPRRYLIPGGLALAIRLSEAEPMLTQIAGHLGTGRRPEAICQLGPSAVLLSYGSMLAEG